MSFRFYVVWTTCLLTYAVEPSFAVEKNNSTATDGAAVYEKEVQPILVRHCTSCHSDATKRRGGLGLDTRDDLLEGGDTGPAIVAGKPDESLLIQAIRQTGDLTMPPKGKLTKSEIETLEKWIRLGAPYPAPRSASESVDEVNRKRAAGHWAFQPVVKISPPGTTNSDWASTPIDSYILAKLEAAGLKPSPEADRATWLRRVHYDLIGLPPTPEDIAAFLADQSANASEKVVDRLLASPHYGERWGRHWLDLARYADTSGFHNDLDRPHAWRYRDYVIRSFNADKPYARFVAEQLAGDEIDGANEESLIATGFCRNGASNDDNMGKTPAALAQYRADQLDDVISTTSTVFLGITIGCARCHDHKTDPFTAKDYYSLLAIFNGTEKYGLVPGTEDAKGKKVPFDPKIQIMGLVETRAEVPVAHVMRRGLASELGDEVGPAVPRVLVDQPLGFPTPSTGAKSSLRRKTLAEWITSPENPLTWRVLANRVWQHHFGVGIVASSGNFGFTGTPPTHPELLDFLAQELIASGGRLKPLHKMIVLSATYRQSSTMRNAEFGVRNEGRSENPNSKLHNPQLVDPENRLLWRMNLRRLEAEAVRDGILAASGKLNPKLGGPGIKPRIRADLIPASQRNKWPAVAQENETHWRRSVYIYSKRQLQFPLLELFDAPTTTDSCPIRSPSVVPTQSLVLMNDEFVEDQATYLAHRVLADGGDDLPKVIEAMFLRTLAHPPTPERLERATKFIRERETESDRVAALTDLAHVLFNSSEFITIP